MATAASSTATSSRTILKDNDTSWVRVPFLVNFGQSFSNAQESLQWLANMSDSYSSTVDADGAVTDGSLSPTDPSSSLYSIEWGNQNPSFLSYPAYSDTRVGANDAINCIWQFNRDDDIVHPINVTGGDENAEIGMGRVYAENTNRNQTIAYFTFGVPVFTGAVNFFTEAFDQNLIRANMEGGVGLGGQILSAMFNATVGALVLAITVPLLAVRWIGEVLKSSKQYKIDRFYDLRTTMHLYYRYVDSILVQWMVGLDFITGNYENDGNTSQDERALAPRILKDTGVSIFNIMALRGKLLGKRSGYFDSDTINDNEYDWESDLVSFGAMDANEYDNKTINDNNIDTTTDFTSLVSSAGSASAASWMTNRVDFTTAMATNILGATQFVGFRIEKSTDASESFSNSTAPNPLAEQFNAKVQEAMATKDTIGHLGESGGLIDSAMSALKSVFTGAASLFGVDGLSEAVIGNAFVDIPESYRGSDFNKSHSLSFQLRAPYGDTVSIYQSIMVPLAMILAAALPRAGGAWSYVQPFLCRVYVKGMFAIPLGIIDSLSIKRGASEFGWTYKNLPTRVDVTMSIKDLSPMIYMAMADKTFMNPFQANNSFKEYMLTLSGVGLFDRVSRFSQIKRNLMTTAMSARRKYLNPTFWSSAIGDTTLAMAIGAAVPFTVVKNN